MTQSLSNYFLKNAGIDLNKLITSDYCCMKNDTFSYHVEEYHTTLFHTQPPQDQYSSPPYLYKCLIATDTDVEYQSIPITTNQKEHVSLCNGELYQTYFGIGPSQPLSEQCRCILVMYVSGFGGLMQWRLTHKIHEPVNAES